MTTERIWLITGASSGFGRALAEAAVTAGDRVIGAARRPDALADLATEHPDVGGVGAAGRHRGRRHRRRWSPRSRSGTAGSTCWSTTPVTARSERSRRPPTQELRDLFELHLFGPTALVKAVLPGMRARGRGAIVQMSSMGGQIGVAGFSSYSATKFALEGLSESLAAEVAPFGIRVLVVEPGAFRTSFSGGGLLESEPMDAYAETVGATRKMIKGMDGQQPGDPAKAAEAILTALAADEAPLRCRWADAVDGIVQHGQGATGSRRRHVRHARDAQVSLRQRGAAGHGAADFRPESHLGPACAHRRHAARAIRLRRQARTCPSTGQVASGGSGLRHHLGLLLRAGGEGGLAVGAALGHHRVRLVGELRIEGGAVHLRQRVQAVDVAAQLGAGLPRRDQAVARLRRPGARPRATAAGCR